MIMQSITTTFVVVILSILQLSLTNCQYVDIVQTAINNGQFKTLTAALSTANLVTTLKGPGPFTVFAPTDAAFAKLPAGTVANLLKPENRAQLINILTYHVVSGRALTSGNLMAIGSCYKLQMYNHLLTQITRNTYGLRINNANIIRADVRASNGIIHVIDTVLLP